MTTEYYPCFKYMACLKSFVLFGMWIEKKVRVTFTLWTTVVHDFLSYYADQFITVRPNYQSYMESLATLTDML